MANNIIEKWKFLLEDKEKRVGEIEIENGKIILSKGVYHGVPYVEKYFYSLDNIDRIIFKYQKDGIRNEIIYILDENNKRIKISEKNILQTKKSIKEYELNKSLGVVVIKEEVSTAKGTITSLYEYRDRLCKIETTNEKYNLKYIKEYSYDQFEDLTEGIIKENERPLSEIISDLDTGFIYSSTTFDQLSNILTTIKYHPEKGRLSCSVLNLNNNKESIKYFDNNTEIFKETKYSELNPSELIRKTKITKNGNVYRDITETIINWGGLRIIKNTTLNNYTKTVIIQNNQEISKHLYIYDINKSDFVLKYSNLYTPCKKQMAIHKRQIFTEEKITELKYTQRTVASCVIEKTIINRETNEKEFSKVKFGRNIFTCIDPDKVKIGEHVISINLFNRPVLVRER